jgi:hypothetical protein
LGHFDQSSVIAHTLTFPGVLTGKSYFDLFLIPPVRRVRG